MKCKSCGGPLFTIEEGKAYGCNSCKLLHLTEERIKELETNLGRKVDIITPQDKTI